MWQICSGQNDNALLFSFSCVNTLSIGIRLQYSTYSSQGESHFEGSPFVIVAPVPSCVLHVLCGLVAMDTIVYEQTEA